MFDVEQASYAIDGRPLLEPTSLQLREGQVIGLIGHNGSGKSTLLKLLARQLPLSQGQIRLDDKPIAQWGDRDFARQVAYLAQQLPTTDNLTVRELVQFGRYPWRGLLGRLRPDDHQQVERAMQLTDTLPMAERVVDTLSGGERQRVWLAMLLAQNSRYLLLDEPLAALDVAHQVDVMALIQKLSRELNLGVVVVIHDINMAARYCDHLIALHSSRLLVQGNPQEIMRGETLESIYGLPMQVMPHPAHQQPVALIQ